MNNSKIESEKSAEVANPAISPPRVPRRSFLRRMGLGAVALGPGAALLGPASRVLASKEEISEGDAAMLRFAAAAEILETDFWVQYNELGGIQDNEVKGGTGNPTYTNALKVLDGDMTSTFTITPRMSSRTRTSLMLISRLRERQR